MVILTLPWPPSVNRYWRRRGSRYFVCAEGQQFRKEVIALSLEYKGFFKAEDRLSVSIQAFPPDRRRRDLDNVLKGLLDSLQHAEIYVDDNQIDKLFISRELPLLGQVIVAIKKVDHHP